MMRITSQRRARRCPSTATLTSIGTRAHTPSGEEVDALAAAAAAASFEYPGPSILSVSQNPTTTMRITSQKRARRGSPTATLSRTGTRAHTPSGEEEDALAATAASASRAVRNLASLRLPTELIYTIVAIAIGDYIGDMMLFPSRILQWDAILTLLHVSSTFRGCTIKLLYHLWGDTFIRERTRYVPLSHPFSLLALRRG